MNKYQTGVYHVHLFDRHGTRQKTLLVRKGLTVAIRKGEKKTRKPPFASYAITRVLVNSVDNSEPWGPRDAGA